MCRRISRRCSKFFPCAYRPTERRTVGFPQGAHAVLADYARQGRFPINYYRQERIPVFIDEHDTHCAVGYLMQHTGRRGHGTAHR